MASWLRGMEKGPRAWSVTSLDRVGYLPFLGPSHLASPRRNVIGNMGPFPELAGVAGGERRRLEGPGSGWEGFDSLSVPVCLCCPRFRPTLQQDRAEQGSSRDTQDLHQEDGPRPGFEPPRPSPTTGEFTRRLTRGCGWAGRGTTRRALRAEAGDEALILSKPSAAFS